MRSVLQKWIIDQPPGWVPQVERAVLWGYKVESCRLDSDLAPHAPVVVYTRHDQLLILDCVTKHAGFLLAMLDTRAIRI